MTDWLRYSNRGVRNQPLNPRLINALDFLGPMGVTMDVFSGGQPSTGPNRVGSHRHDEGNAGDVMFFKGNRPLNWANDADRPLFEDIVRKAKARGVTGFGAGEGYMRPGSMHIGFGTPAVWGAGGSGANAPGWLRSAAAGSTGNVPPTPAAQEIDIFGATPPSQGAAPGPGFQPYQMPLTPEGWLGAIASGQNPLKQMVFSKIASLIF